MSIEEFESVKGHIQARVEGVIAGKWAYYDLQDVINGQLLVTLTENYHTTSIMFPADKESSEVTIVDTSAQDFILSRADGPGFEALKPLLEKMISADKHKQQVEARAHHRSLTVFPLKDRLRALGFNPS